MVFSNLQRLRAMNSAPNAGAGPPPVTAARTSSKTGPTGENVHATVLGMSLFGSTSHARKLSRGHFARFNPMQIKSIVPKHKHALH